MQRNINFFDSNSIFVSVLRDIKPVALQTTSRPNILQDTDPNIIEFVKSPIMERLTNSVFLVLRDASRVDIWGQVKHQHFKSRSNNPDVVIFYMRQHLWNPVGWVGNATGHSFELGKLYAGAPIRSRIRDLVPNGTNVPIWSRKSPDFACKSRISDSTFRCNTVLQRRVGAK